MPNHCTGFEENTEKQLAMIAEMQDLFDGKGLLDIVAALGTMTVNVIAQCAKTPEAATEGIEAHIRDLREGMAELVAKADKRH